MKFNFSCFLFRYEGEDPKAKADVSGEKSDHLQRLLSKIEDRKLALIKHEEDNVKEKLLKLKEKRKEKNRKLKENKKEREEAQAEEAIPATSKRKDRDAKRREKIGSLIEGKFTILGDESLGARKSKVSIYFWPHNSIEVVSFQCQSTFRFCFFCCLILKLFLRWKPNCHTGLPTHP